MKSARAAMLGLATGAFALAAMVADEPRAASAAYTYDEAGRVRSVRYDNGTCVIYAYDASGNRTSQTITSGGAPSTPTWGTGAFGCFYWTP